MSDLVKRLRDLHQDYVDDRWRQYETVKGILSEAADRIESLETENAFLKNRNVGYKQELEQARRELSERNMELEQTEAGYFQELEKLEATIERVRALPRRWKFRRANKAEAVELEAALGEER